MSRAVKNPEKGHYYRFALIGPEGLVEDKQWDFPGVTTILDDVIAKPRLQHWFYTQGVKGFVELLRSNKPLPRDEKALRAMLGKTGLSPYSKRDAAASEGTERHSLLKALASGTAVARTTQTAGILDWFEARGLSADDILAVEEPLVSFKYGYAGTLDLVYKDPETGRIVLCDLKTGKYVFWTHFVQGEAYRVAYIEEGNEPPDLVTVLHCPVDGGFKELAAPGLTFDIFKAALDIFNALPANWKPDDLDIDLGLVEKEEAESG